MDPITGEITPFLRQKRQKNAADEPSTKDIQAITENELCSMRARCEEAISLRDRTIQELKEQIHRLEAEKSAVGKKLSEILESLSVSRADQ